MKSDRDIMNDLARKSDLLYELSEEESKKLKSLLLEMYKDIAAVCHKNALSVMLIGGSALGAVRHKGFIPWDDDLDLAMPRSDYNKLIEFLQNGALNEKYKYNAPSKNVDSKNNFLKIFRKGTTDAEIFEDNMPFPKGVFIDIFPIENAPSPSFLTRLRGRIVDAFSIIGTCVLFSQYKSETYKCYMKGNPDAYKRYKLRLFIGRIARIFGNHRKWVYWNDRIAQYHKDTGFVTIPTGTKRYCGEMVKKDVLLPASPGVFEGIEVSLPHNPDAYLTNMYKNYMWIPPVEKRERHFVYKFSLTEEL